MATAAERKRAQREREKANAEADARAEIEGAPTKPLRPCPPAPKRRKLGWHPQARSWWNSMAKSPQARRWLESDWAHLRLTLVLVDRFWRADDEGEAGLAANLAGRINTMVGQLGGTARARHLLGWGNQAPGQPVQPSNQAGKPAGSPGSDADQADSAANVINVGDFSSLHRTG